MRDAPWFLGVDLTGASCYSLAPTAYQSAFAAGIARLIGRETMAATAGVRGFATLTRDATLGFGTHGCETTTALGS